MSNLGSVAAIWRYPVKSMGGQQLPSAALTPHGLAHDRLYAFESPEAPAGMLRVTGAQRRELLRYHARLDATGNVLVRTPAGLDLPVDDPSLLGPGFLLTQKPTPQTDVRPLSLISLQTVAQLSAELGEPLDPQRFRANFYLDLPAGAFAEDLLVGSTVRLGGATVRIRERDPRCRFITYAPAAPHSTPPLFALMKLLDRLHGGRAGVYASVVSPGEVAQGDRLAPL